MHHINNKQPYIFLFLVSLFFLGVIVVLFFLQPTKKECNIILSDAQKTIYSWHNEKTQADYFVLPMFCKDKDNYQLGSATDKIEILFSSAVATVFIDTATESMQELTNNKNHKENVSFMIVDNKGAVQYLDKESILKGHGNTTWKAEKKSFNVYLDESLSLLGMSECAKWVLMANAYDSTGLRNAIAFDLAHECGMPYTPEYRMVDVYFNGDYYGLYMLTQSIDSLFEEKDKRSGEKTFLYCVDLESRIDDKETSYKIGNDVTIREVYSANSSELLQQEAVQKLFLADKAVNNGVDVEEYIDIDSWVYRYLIDEILENIDGGKISSYFFIDSNKEAKICAGPIWDYDLTIDNEYRSSSLVKKDDPSLLFAANPSVLFIANPHFSSNTNIMWYYKLYNNDIFYSRMIEIYKDNVRNYVNEISERLIYEYIDTYADALACNNLRWENENSQDDIDNMISWLKKRIEFLDSVWIDNISYNNVAFDNGTGYPRMFFVKSGMSVLDDPMAKKWFDEEYVKLSDGSMYNLATSVYSDEYIQISKYRSIKDNLMTKLKYNLYIVFLFLLCMTLIGLVVVDFKNSCWRGKSDEIRM